MAYIPPHKRHSKDSDTPSPTPSLFHQKRNPKHAHSKILYAKGGTHRWFVLPWINSDDDTHENPQLQLKEFPYEPLERIDGAKPMILVCKDHPHKESNEKADVILKAPWVSIEEKIQHDLINAFQIARSRMCKDGPELYMPHFVIRFGKILFHGGPIVSLDDINEPSAIESILGRLKRRYNTNVPDSFVQAILTEFVPKIGLDFLGEKESYHVKVFDKSQPDATIWCKCRLREESGELDIYKIALNEMRQLVVDISCLDKNLDLRLFLSSKRILVSLTDDEKDSLISLVKSAVIDSEVKGGLRWPLGKESLGDRYTVVGIWHTKAKTFRNSYARLRVRHADRFDFRTSIGEVSQEASLTIPELTKQLRDETLELELEPLLGMVSETLKLVWEHFLCWEGSVI